MFLSVVSFSVLVAGSTNLRTSSSLINQLFDLDDSAEEGKSKGAEGVNGRGTGGLMANTVLETILLKAQFIYEHYRPVRVHDESTASTARKEERCAKHHSTGQATRGGSEG